jgi:hypothetical protein
MKHLGTNEELGLLAYNAWLASVGVSLVTGWRWRKKGWLNPVNICGRLYLTHEDIAQFKSRAVAGRFAVTPQTPARRTRS